MTGKQTLSFVALYPDQAISHPRANWPWLRAEKEGRKDRDCALVFENQDEARFLARAGRYAITEDGREILLDTAIRAKRWPLVATIRMSPSRNSQSTPFRMGRLSSLETAKTV